MDRVQAIKVASSDATVSDKIRALDAAGYPRAEIARLLNNRYQHVRNVLEGDKLYRSNATAPIARGVAEPPRPFLADSATLGIEDRGRGAYRLAVREDGSVLLPASVRVALGVGEQGAVMARFEGGEFKIIGGKTALRRLREMLTPYVRTDGVLASEELIAERRAEAEREANG